MCGRVAETSEGFAVGFDDDEVTNIVNAGGGDILGQPSDIYAGEYDIVYVLSDENIGKLIDEYLSEHPVLSRQLSNVRQLA